VRRSPPPVTRGNDVMKHDADRWEGDGETVVTANKPEIVARCNICGRDYVYVNPEGVDIHCLVSGCDGLVREIRS
jgi:hypothetical protein